MAGPAVEAMQDAHPAHRLVGISSTTWRCVRSVVFIDCSNGRSCDTVKKMWDLSRSISASVDCRRRCCRNGKSRAGVVFEKVIVGVCSFVVVDVFVVDVFVVAVFVAVGLVVVFFFFFGTASFRSILFPSGSKLGINEISDARLWLRRSMWADFGFQEKPSR